MSNLHSDIVVYSVQKLLGLDGNVVLNTQEDKGIDLPLDHSVSKVDNKIHINCGTSSKNRIVLDVSSLKEGAPGRTRGIFLDVYTIGSFSDGLNEINNLS